MEKKSESPSMFTKKCKVCGKIISSLSKSQFDYNYEQHIKSHGRKND